MPFALPFSIVSIICFCVVISFICFADDTLSPEEMETAKECKNQMKVFIISFIVLINREKWVEF